MRRAITVGAAMIGVLVLVGVTLTEWAERRAAEIQESLLACTAEADELFPETPTVDSVLTAPPREREARLEVMEQRAGFLEACLSS